MYPDDFVAKNLDQVAASEGLPQTRRAIQQRAQSGNLEFPALG